MNVFCAVSLILLGLGQDSIAVDPQVTIEDLDPNFAAEIKGLKTTLESVQGSLITSVGLIQDQLDQFSKQMTTSVDSRLEKLELRMASYEDSMKKVEERSEGWTAMQHHILSWGDQMISLDSKVDHLARSQMERLTTITGQVSNLQSTLGHSVETLGEQITNLEGRLHRVVTDSNPQVISSLQRIESKLASSRVRAKLPFFQQGGQHLHTRGLCNDLKSSVDTLTAKFDLALSKNADSNPRKNNEANSYPVITSPDSENDFELALTGLESEMEQQLIKLFRRLSLPFKKANRRLRDMEDIGRQLESTMGEIRTNVQIASADFDRRFSDFFNMTLEMFEHQHHQIELSEKSLAGISLCCSGTASDLSDFKAKTEAFLSKFESRNNAQDASDEITSRFGALMRFETERLLSKLKDQENILIDGFDQCQKVKIIDRRPMEIPEVVATSTEMPPLPSVTAALVQGQAEVVSETEKILKTCEQLYRAGFMESKVYTVESTKNDPEFKQRYCDQTTSGGGWTVIQRRGGQGNGRRINFTRPWKDYKEGFGDLNKEFWYGNDFIHDLTNDPDTAPMTLRIELEDFDGVKVVAEYDTFKVEPESSDYRLWIGGYSGNATDSLSAHNGSAFSTFDQTNDAAPKCCPCAPSFGGGWWFYSCFEANLNGEYYEDPVMNGYFRGIIWEKWRGDYSLKSATMKIRSKAFRM